MNRNAWYERTGRNLGSLEAQQGESGYGSSGAYAAGAAAVGAEIEAFLSRLTPEQRAKYEAGGFSVSEWEQWVTQATEGSNGTQA